MQAKPKQIAGPPREVFYVDTRPAAPLQTQDDDLELALWYRRKLQKAKLTRYYLFVAVALSCCGLAVAAVAMQKGGLSKATIADSINKAIPSANSHVKLPESVRLFAKDFMRYDERFNKPIRVEFQAVNMVVQPNFGDELSETYRRIQIEKSGKSNIPAPPDTRITGIYYVEFESVVGDALAKHSRWFFYLNSKDEIYTCFPCFERDWKKGIESLMK